MRLWLLLLLLLWSAPGYAHGTQPAVWQLLSADDQGAAAVRLSEGLGLRRADGSWRFVCSTRWHGPTSPQIARMKDGTFWLSAGDGEHQLNALGQDLRTVHVGASSDLVHAFAATPAQAVVLAADETSATLYTLGTNSPHAFWHATQPWSGLVSDGSTFWLAAARPDGFDLAHVQSDGQEIVQHVMAPQGSPRVHVSAGQVFVTVYDGALDHVGRVDAGVWQEIATSPPSVLGPEQVNGHVFAAQGGILREFTTTGQPTTDDNRYFTCVDALGGLPYVCARQDLRKLANDGTAREVIFDIAELTPPSQDGLDAAQRDLCWTEWQNFSKDAGLPLGTFQSDLEGAQTSDSAPKAACAATRSGPGEGLAFGLALACACLFARRATSESAAAAARSRRC